MAELVGIIEYLQKHDNLAKTLASNAKVFGESYLRLEDYLCYDAAILEEFGNVLKGSNALKPFNLTKLSLDSFR